MVLTGDNWRSMRLDADKISVGTWSSRITGQSTEQQKVETQVIESKNVIVIQQANPQVIYVPSYDPVVVWGPPIYPYPPIYYPTGYYVAGVALSFGMGAMMGAFWSGGWGWGCGWGGNNNININRNNNFVRNGSGNFGGGNRASQLPSGGANRPGGVGGVGGAGGVGGVGGVGGAGGVGGVGGNRPSQLPSNGNSWQHNPEHRGGAPYKDRATADRFGGTARGDSLARRQASARQQISRQGGSFGSNRAAGGAGLANRAGGGAGVGNRAAGSAGVGNRAAGGAGGGGLGGGPDRIGTRDLSRTGGGNRDAFGGGSRGFDGASARSSSSRGMSSFGGGGGGGFSRGGGGGGRGGGRR